MSIKFSCEECGKSFTLDDKFAGKKGKCKQCGAIMQIPFAESSRSLRGDRVVSSPKRAPAPPTGPRVDVYGFEDEPLPPRSPGGAIVEELAASGLEPMRYPKRPGLYPAPSRSSSPGGGQLAFKVIVRVVLGIVGGFAGLVATAVGLPGLRSLVTPGGWSSRSQIESFVKRQVDLTNELTGILRSVTDVPSATATSSRANASVRKLTENLRTNKDRRGNQKDIDEMKQKYAFSQRQALQDFTGEIQRVASISGALDALAVQESLMELAAIEETIPSIQQQAGLNPSSNPLGRFQAPPLENFQAPRPTFQRVQIPGTGFNTQPPLMPGPISGPGFTGPSFGQPRIMGPPSMPGMPPRPNFPGPPNRGRVGGPRLGPG